MRALLPLPARARDILPGLLLPVLLALAAGGAPAQQETGALIVSVTARETGKPMEGVKVRVVGTGIVAATNASGVLRLAGVPLGTQTVEVRRLGYATRLRLVRLEAGRAVSASFALEMEAVPVAMIRVEAKARPGYLERAGFERRRAMGVGSFVTREEIERQRPRFMSDVLRRFPGVTLIPYEHGRGAHAVMGRAPTRNCPIQYYVDGQIIGPGFNIDEVSPHDVEGVEIYRGASQLPPEFNRRTAMCGVIAIWTRQV